MPQSLRRQYLIDIFRSRFPETRLLHLENALRESARYAGQNANSIDQWKSVQSASSAVRFFDLVAAWNLSC